MGRNRDTLEETDTGLKEIGTDVIHSLRWQGPGTLEDRNESEEQEQAQLAKQKQLTSMRWRKRRLLELPAHVRLADFTVRAATPSSSASQPAISQLQNRTKRTWNNTSSAQSPPCHPPSTPSPQPPLQRKTKYRRTRVPERAVPRWACRRRRGRSCVTMAIKVVRQRTSAQLN